MDFDAIVNLVTNIGFPIAACVAIFRQMNKQDEAHAKEVEMLRESHTKQIELLRESVDGNTIAITELVAKMEVIVGDKSD